MKKLSTTSFKNNSGQALLVILLTMSVALTVVLSVSSRSVTDITTTTYEEDALRAFNAAEAGVEEALITETNSGVVQIDSSEDPGLTYDAVVTSLASGNEHHYQKKLKAGEIATFWFVDRDSDGNFVCDAGNCLSTSNVELCWGEPETLADEFAPAIQVFLYYDSSPSGNSVVTTVPNNHETVEKHEFTFDPYDARGNNFTSATTGCSWSSDYAFSAIIDIDNLDQHPGDPTNCEDTEGCLLFAGVKMLYNNEPGGMRHGLALDAGGLLPPQGIEIESIGKAGESTRKVKVVQGHPESQHGFWGAIWGNNDL